MMEVERWLPVPGFKGKYEVSDLGRIRSLRFANGLVDRLREVPRAGDAGVPKKVLAQQYGISLCHTYKIIHREIRESVA